MDKKQRRNIKLLLLPVLALCLFLAVIPMRADAASPKKDKWVAKNSRFYYYNSKGKRTKGLRQIKGKYYYFDKKGVQHTGWQKIRGNYYFFKNANGKKGYMVTSAKVNHVTLKKDGKAKLTNDSRANLNVLIKANKIVEKATKPAMTKEQKLKKCFDYSLKNFRYRGSPSFYYSSHWERKYALDMFDRGHGSCYSYGAAFAYLANAIGYKDAYAISSGGHGWAEVQGKVYDPSWALVDRRYSYYGVSYSLSGVGGRPGYRRAIKYRVNI